MKQLHELHELHRAEGMLQPPMEHGANTEKTRRQDHAGKAGSPSALRALPSQSKSQLSVHEVAGL